MPWLIPALAALSVLSHAQDAVEIVQDVDVSGHLDAAERALEAEDWTTALIEIGALDIDVMLTEDQRARASALDLSLFQHLNASTQRRVARGLSQDQACALDRSVIYFTHRRAFQRLVRAADGCATAPSRDSAVTASHRVVAQYPMRAFERGLSGQCRGWFDVDPDGAVTHIAVTCSDPIFERSTGLALSRWRYPPRIVDGQAVWRRNVSAGMTFKQG